MENTFCLKFKIQGQLTGLQVKKRFIDENRHKRDIPGPGNYNPSDYSGGQYLLSTNKNLGSIKIKESSLKKHQISKKLQVQDHIGLLVNLDILNSRKQASRFPLDFQEAQRKLQERAVWFSWQSVDQYL